MPREELIRKYLAVKAHMAAQQEKDASTANTRRKDVRSRAGNRVGSSSGKGKKKNMFGIVSDDSDSDSDGNANTNDEDDDFFNELRGKGKSRPAGPFSSQTSTSGGTSVSSKKRATDRDRSSAGSGNGSGSEKATPWVPFKANLGGAGTGRAPSQQKQEERTRQASQDRSNGQPTEADIRRKQRVACLQEDIPRMGVSDLRLLMKAK